MKTAILSDNSFPAVHGVVASHSGHIGARWQFSPLTLCGRRPTDPAVAPLVDVIRAANEHNRNLRPGDPPRLICSVCVQVLIDLREDGISVDVAVAGVGVAQSRGTHDAS